MSVELTPEQEELQNAAIEFAKTEVIAGGRDAGLDRAHLPGVRAKVVIMGKTV